MIQLLRLNNGDVLIGDIIESEKHYIVNNPYLLQIVPTEVAGRFGQVLVPHPFVNKDNPILYLHQNAIAYTIPEDSLIEDLLIEYKQQTSGLVIPKPNISNTSSFN